MEINISKEFSEVPWGRYYSDGKYSGQRFREEFLKTNLEQFDQVAVNIDDVEGYGSSFLDEAFGGLVRKGYYNKDSLSKKLKIKCNDPYFKMYADLIWKYINEAKFGSDKDD
jgi:nitrogen regulatory protein PII